MSATQTLSRTQYDTYRLLCYGLSGTDASYWGGSGLSGLVRKGLVRPGRNVSCKILVPPERITDDKSRHGLGELVWLPAQARQVYDLLAAGYTGNQARVKLDLRTDTFASRMHTLRARGVLASGEQQRPVPLVRLRDLRVAVQLRQRAVQLPDALMAPYLLLDEALAGRTGALKRRALQMFNHRYDLDAILCRGRDLCIFRVWIGGPGRTTLSSALHTLNWHGQAPAQSPGVFALEDPRSLGRLAELINHAVRAYTAREDDLDLPASWEPIHGDQGGRNPGG